MYSISMWSIYKLVKFLTKILQWYCGNNFSFVKQQRISWISERTKGSSRWNFTIFWCQYPFHQYSCMSIPWNHKQEIYRTYKPIRNGKLSGTYLLHTKDKVISLLELVLYNCVFSFQEKILPITPRSCNGCSCISIHCQHLHGIL